MGRVGFCFSEALRALARRPLSSLLTVGTVALSLFLAGTIWGVSQGLRTSVDRWGTGAVVAVYLQPGTSAEDRGRIQGALERIPGARKVRFVSREHALARLRKGLGPDAALLEGVEPKWLPESFLVTLKGSRSSLVAAQDRLVELGRAMDAIQEVRTVREWHRKVESLAGLLSRIAGGLVLVTFVICGYVVASTVRLGQVSRSQETAVLHDLGAPGWFVTVPAMVEGGLTALLGAIGAMGLLYGLFVLLGRELDAFASGLAARGFWALMPVETVLASLGMVLLAGLAGSRLAVRKWRGALP